MKCIKMHVALLMRVLVDLEFPEVLYKLTTHRTHLRLHFFNDIIHQEDGDVDKCTAYKRCLPLSSCLCVMPA